MVELLVAGILSAVVILVAWSGLVSAMSMSQEAQARSARQAELNQALDFMTNEIRMARSINASSTLTANGTTVTLPDVVTSAGVNLANVGSYGTIGLYLERPTSPVIPAICPVGGPNAGAPPPMPTDFDPVVYDIRPSPSGWLKPTMVARYGRIPATDGTINPCSSPTSSDPMVDALSTNRASSPSCSGVLSGAGGFYSCVEGKQVNLFFQSDISNVQVKQVNSTVTSRLMPITQPQKSGNLSITMHRTGMLIGNVQLTWQWSGNPSTVTGYKVYEESGITTRATQLIYTGMGNNFSHRYAVLPSQKSCYWVEATTSAGATVTTTQTCFTA